MGTDVIVQAVSQPAAHRLVLYATSPHLQAFPSERRFCDNAQELGLGASDYKGPGLVLLQNCTVTPKEFVEHIMGCFLRGYIVRIYWCHCVSASKSNFVLHLKDLVAALKDDEFCDSKEGQPESTSQATLNAKTISCTDAIHTKQCNHEILALSNVKIRLQTFPRKLSSWLIDELPELDCVMHHFSHSLYAVESDGVVRYGIGKGEDMYLMACDREALFKGFVARACSKLEEVLHVKGIKLMQEMLVLDVGAAPGAWTEFLGKSVCHVVAVDPGQLDRNVLGERVTHICKKAQDALEDLMLWTRERSFDLLVCDINKHPVEAAEVVLPLLEFLKSGSYVILTLKFHGRGKDKIHKVAELKDIFKDSLMEMESIWLLANSIYERTFVGIKK